MAHSHETKRKVRSSYCYEQLPLNLAGEKHGVTAPTAYRWKEDFFKLGDDWDKERNAHSVSVGGVEEATAVMLRSYIRQHNSIMETLEAKDNGLNPEQKVKMLTMLSDSYSKMLASHRKYTPQISELATALDVMTFFSDHLEQHHADLLPAFLAVLEDFGSGLGARYG